MPWMRTWIHALNIMCNQSKHFPSRFFLVHTKKCKYRNFLLNPFGKLSSAQIEKNIKIHVFVPFQISWKLEVSSSFHAIFWRFVPKFDIMLSNPWIRYNKQNFERKQKIYIQIFWITPVITKLPSQIPLIGLFQGFWRSSLKIYCA